MVRTAALDASADLDADRFTLYFDLIVSSLSEAARKSLQAMDPAKYEYQSEFAKRFVAEGVAKGVAQGMAKGVAKGRTELVLKLLNLKFGKLSARTKKRVSSATAAELDGFAERILTATTLGEVWRPAKKR